ncbi:MAG: fibrobacter succinogenes major paralogous domain-containing protein [Prolixibacteraceae bacterium]|nr:fibrobacter succinogenes major paralogous domain-containing protein [Prolixibacteraceae bacterium]
MRTTSTIYIYFLLILLTIAFGSCKSDSNEDPLANNKGEATDIDGNVYKTVTIGTQVWMAENLKTTKYRNGDPIPNVTGSVTWVNLKTGALCDYNNSQNSSAKYGKLYNWYTVVDSRNIAPIGWRVASNSDWETLILHLGGENMTGGKLKETGVLNWVSPNFGATNSSGFTALPSGGRGDHGDYFGIGEVGNWWTTDNPTTLSDDMACTTYIYSNEESLGRTFTNRYVGFSVRCIKE